MAPPAFRAAARLFQPASVFENIPAGKAFAWGHFKPPALAPDGPPDMLKMRVDVFFTYTNRL
jgi:hypothetical protein